MLQYSFKKYLEGKHPLKMHLALVPQALGGPKWKAIHV
jgi:hypothetical protein